MTKAQEMLDWAWEKHRAKVFGVHGEYPIDAYVHFAAGYEAAGEPQSSSNQAVADALSLLSDLFSETVHDAWTKEEVVAVIEDFAKLRCPDTRPDGNSK
jgi:hypothetical protein